MNHALVTPPYLPYNKNFLKNTSTKNSDFSANARRYQKNQEKNRNVVYGRITPYIFTFDGVGNSENYKARKLE